MAEKIQCPSCQCELVCPECNRDIKCPACEQAMRLNEFGAIPKHKVNNTVCVASDYTPAEAANVLQYVRRR